MLTYCVYKHTNTVNGKSYIGMCADGNTHTRWANGHGYYQQKQFGDEIKRYGWERFSHDILFSGLSKETAIKKERECIEKYCTLMPNGYNISIRGDKPFWGQHHTEEAKNAISEKLKLYKMTDEHKRHISEKKTGVLHHMAKAVYQFSKGGEFIKGWPYMNKAAEELGICKTSISACCRGKRPSAGGYVWSYERG